MTPEEQIAKLRADINSILDLIEALTVRIEALEA
jgi:hypothetical protein